MDKGRISGRQLMYLVVTLVFATGVMFLPAITGKEAGPDAWLASLLVTGFGALICLPLGALSRRFPGLTPVDYSIQLMGPVLGRAAGLLLVWYSLHTGAIVAREFGELMVSITMPETPVSVFILLQVWLASVLARNGVEVIARVNEFWLPIAILATFIIILLVLSRTDWGLLLPVLEHGWAPVFRGSIPPAAWAGEAVVLLFALACLNQPKESVPALVKGQVLSGLLLTLGAAVNLAVFGPEELSRMVFPTLYLSRIVDVARFITRIESLTIILWLVSTLVKVSLFLYGAAVGLARTAGLNDYVPLVLPLGAMAAGMGLGMFPNLPSLVQFLGGPWPLWALAVELSLPLLLLGLAWLRPAQRGGVTR